MTGPPGASNAAANPCAEGDSTCKATIPIYYATDRRPASSALAAFTGLRDDTLRYGRVTVTFPPNHQFGELERPSIWHLDFTEDTARHVVMKQLQPMSNDRWVQELRWRVAQSGRKSALVFVHGYNVSFADAILRTAQIAHDISFDGPSIAYSWPSQGRMLGYAADEATVQTAGVRLKIVLKQIVARTGARNIYLVAHSMGNRALTEALTNLRFEQPAIRSYFKEVVLAAPDIDADYFRTAIVPNLPKAAEHVTLYASSADYALAASHRFHSYPRAGESGSRLLVLPGIDTIDASGVHGDWLGHSYIADAGPVLRDLRAIVTHRALPAQRQLRLQEMRGRAYWAFPVQP